MPQAQWAGIAGSALIATYPTARFATGLDPHALRLAFAVFLATIAVTVAYCLRRGNVRVATGPTRAWGWTTVVGLIGGVFSGLFGVGGAFVAPPLARSWRCWRMPGPVGSIGLSDCRSHLAASRRSPLASRSPAACPRDGCGWRSADCCCLPQFCWRRAGDPSQADQKVPPSKTSSPSGSKTHGCFLRVHMCLVGRSQDVSSSVPPLTRTTPSLAIPQIQEPHSGQTSLVLMRPLSAVR